MSAVIQDTYFEPTGSAKALIRSIESLISDGAKSLLIMSCDNGLLPQDINDYLLSLPVPVFGGIFPKLVYKGESHDRGCLIISFNITAVVTVLKPNSSTQNFVSKFDSTNNVNNFFIFVDSFMQNIDQLLSSIYEEFSPHTSAIGGGCGVPALKQSPCLFTNDGLLENALVVASVPAPMSVSTAHGWKVMDGPYLVTKSDGNIIYTLNHAPALQVYKEAIRKNTGLYIDENEFYDLAKSHPLGLDQLDNEILVRDPISIEGDALVCVGCVPINSSVYILKGTNEQIIHAAGQAAFELKNRLNENRNNHTFFLFDCISRALFLGDKLDHEINLIRSTLPKQAELITVLSLGEIALGENTTMHFYNKSIVLGSVN